MAVVKPPDFREQQKTSAQDFRDQINKLKSGNKSVLRATSTQTVLDAKNITLGELADFVGTLVQKLQDKGINV